jgi:hypothetical protein
VPIVFKGPGFYVTDNAAQNSAAKLDEKRDGDKPAEGQKEPEPANLPRSESEKTPSVQSRTV